MITAGNSCPTNDGVSAALLMSEKKALALGLDAAGAHRRHGVGGVKPQLMGLGPDRLVEEGAASTRASAPSRSTASSSTRRSPRRCCRRCRELGIPLDKVNVNGGSIAIGHPLGATGARLVLTVAKELRRSGGRYGLATQCIGAGMGISTDPRAARLKEEIGMSERQFILYETDGPVAVLTLDRPEARNAQHPPFLEQLDARLPPRRGGARA